MTLATGTSSQNTEFCDTEGLTYIGQGRFVMTEERDRQLIQFTYVPETVLTRAAAQTVKLGTSIGNTGFEGPSYDPQNGGYIVVKEITPLGIFQTSIDFPARTASNGSPTATGSTTHVWARGCPVPVPAGAAARPRRSSNGRVVGSAALPGSPPDGWPAPAPPAPRPVCRWVGKWPADSRAPAAI